MTTKGNTLFQTVKLNPKDVINKGYIVVKVDTEATATSHARTIEVQLPLKELIKMLKEE